MAEGPIITESQKIKATLTQQVEDVEDDNVDGGFDQRVEINMDDPEVQNAVRAALQSDPLLAQKIVDKAPEVGAIVGKIKIGKVVPVGTIELAPMPEHDAVGENFTQATAGTAAADDRTRYQDTSLETGSGRISMIVAITQGLLNSQLQTNQIINNLGTLDASNDRGDTIMSELRPPKLALDIAGNGGPSKVFYHMFFDTGGSWTTKNESGTFCTVNTDGWVFVAETTLTLQTLDKRSEEYNKAKTGFHRNGNYNINRLILDLTNEGSVKPRMDLSEFGVQILSEGEFERFASLVISALRDSFNQALAYSLEGIGAEVESTFAPTAQRLQCLPYRKDGKDPISEGLTQEGDKNLLVYVSMTQNQAFPEIWMLPYSGNWCVPPSIPATMAIGRTVFFDSFLIPRLNEINKATFIKATAAPKMENKIIVPVNKSEVHINCKTTVVLFQQAKGFGIKQNGSVMVEQTGEIIINLKSINSGRLELEMKKNSFNIKKSTDKSFLQPEKNMNNLANSMQGKLAGADLQGKIAAAGSRLTTVDTFILPGNQQFLLEDATFNDEHDLLVQVGYNG
ncbi:uncharacterized protein A1O9_02712 [Exophiala aquamarina CBS 119918]|uniref:Uncharacterized protein n=1 Tax=Exophiala aquamarina CBS 119918 TaxID=1182545 RepID=A0A072PN14_9EURO|nr:uncharacterized protein A1O9_02712 [Exophiala aquamarina CBS 119918]KEF61147.1 hypothetical protein A1O9_02712 [Exophiala aquamarina CBS 119918]